MSGDAVHPQQVAGAWEEYWRRTREAAAHKGGGPQDEVLARFWATFFNDALPHREHPRLLDLACGNGALTRHALDAAHLLGRAAPLAVGADNSLAALIDLRKRCPSVVAVLADAKSMPFPDRAFDIVSSQFGLEYAGEEAFAEAARLVAPGGTLVAVAHLREGAIYRECVGNLDAAQAIQRCGIFAAAKEAFRLGFAAARGHSAKSDFKRANAQLAAALNEVQAVLRCHGPGVAGGTMHRLCTDITEMYRRVAGYDPAEVARWLDHMARETAAYENRMKSMLAAAIDDAGMNAILVRLGSLGFSVRIREKLQMGVVKEEPGAWAIVCDLPPTG